MRDHRERNPDARFVFTGANGGLHRRSNFRRRVWMPALAGDESRGWTPLNQGIHFHDLRHTHETWLIEDGVPRILRLVRLGHKRKDTDDLYSHVTDVMVESMLAACSDAGSRTVDGAGTKTQLRSRLRRDLFGFAKVVGTPCPPSAPRKCRRPAGEDRRQAV
ncbi:tyrosine-type recombinase/integrase [Amycolatopsis granulosa]|uniref:tyrosine-type recombinase/integrase n=1 Tax=Amycolatopsis granulosa TaxID=185684 RepID=UPI003C7A5AD4